MQHPRPALVNWLSLPVGCPMRPFTLHCPTRLFFGAKAMKRLGRVARSLGSRRLLMILGCGSARENGAFAQAAASLAKAGLAWDELWGCPANPTLDFALQAASRAEAFGADAVLAVGGGSVIDAAKAAALALKLDDPWAPFASDRDVRVALPIFAVATAAGTGSEMNGQAVLSHDGRKRTARGPGLFPMAAFVDPTLHASLPWRQTLAGGVDALAHCLEYHVCGVPWTGLALNETLQRSAVSALDRLQSCPEDVPARADLAWASILALNGTGAAGLGRGDWTCHCLAHGLAGAMPELSHGQALAALLPVWIERVMDRAPEVFDRWAQGVWGQVDRRAGLRALRNRLSAWGAPASLRELGVEETMLEAAAGLAAEHAAVGEVERMGRESLLALLRIAL